MIQKKVFTSLCFGLAFSISSFGQNFEYGNVELVQASFSGDLMIRTDDGGSVYAPPEFVNGSTSDPVAYVSGDKASMSTVLTIDCEEVPDSITVRGVGPEGIEFPATKVLVSASATTVHDIVYPFTEATTAFPLMVARRFQPFKVGWDVSFDDGATWRPVDTTSNTLYVTHTTPMPETGNFKWWQTIYDISCRNADTYATESDIIANIWDEFTDQSVLNWEGDSLKYYNPMYTFNTNLQH